MEIIKRDQSVQAYDRRKISRAVSAAFDSVGHPLPDMTKEAILDQVEVQIRGAAETAPVSVEQIQDWVEQALMRQNCYEEARHYILYRQEHARLRDQIDQLRRIIPDPEILAACRQLQRDFSQPEMSLDALIQKVQAFSKEKMKRSQQLDNLIRACVELVSQEAPDWEKAAARFMMIKLRRSVSSRMEQQGIRTLAQKLLYLEAQGLLNKDLSEHYSYNDLNRLEQAIDKERDQLFNASGLELLIKRYLIRDHQGEVLELPQEMFMGIAMHLAIPEGKHRVEWAIKIYDVLSQLQVTMATPTLANARKPKAQLASCFIDVVPDSLKGIYKSLDSFAQISKQGGGMGLYFGKVRASGSDIRGFQGAAGGVLRWIRLVNDTAVAVDQLGVRQGAVAVYLDCWHRDLPEFLQIRTNNGDDRMKAHDVFPAVCYPDLFWRMAKASLDQNWYLMDPHQIQTVKGYALEDCTGELWEQRYQECVADARIEKRVILLKDLVRLILKSAAETGTPFVFNRDLVNAMNPNGHRGVIYCSNLCTEIAQNIAPTGEIETRMTEINGETVIIEQAKAGEMVVCNLASLNLGRLNTEDEEELRSVIEVTVRALDNVIDLNAYPLPQAQRTASRSRAIGLGVSGLHHWLAKRSIFFESEEHLNAADKLFEAINYNAIRASLRLAQEKGRYADFEGSDWQTGAYFTKRGYTSDAWQTLAKEVARYGLRNGWLLAIAPTSSTSVIAGTSAGVDPIMNKFFLEEKKGNIIARVAPELNEKTYWYYKKAHQIDQTWVVRAAGVRQRHIDQAQSVNLYITTDYSLRDLLNLMILAWEKGVKTLYYVRSQSLEVEECESCSA